MTEEDLLLLLDRLSNWGRWGDDDELGTLNLITPEVRCAAASLVQHGIAISLAKEIATTPPTAPNGTARFGPVTRFMIMSGEGAGRPVRTPSPYLPPDARWGVAAEHLGMVFHGSQVTHLDALSHVFWDGQAYNGRSAEVVTTSAGATALAVTALRAGIVSRGLLADVPLARGVGQLEPGEAVTASELERVLEEHGVTPRQGDVILLRTGAGGSDHPEGHRPGYDPSCLEWFHRHAIAAVGADTENDPVPSPYRQVMMPVHLVGIVAMGLTLIDGCALDELAATCAGLGRYEFLLSIQPLPIQGGTGSPVNPLAIF